MWILALEAGKPVVLASPEHEFNGWIYSVQTKETHGFKDIVVAWHDRAGQASLTYFEWSGRAYRATSGAMLIVDSVGRRKITHGNAST